MAAILAADVVGYSRLMGANEAATLAALKAHRTELIDAKIAEHQGRIVKLTGDGMLVEFTSVVNAVSCAAAIQRKMRERNVEVPENQRIEFRVGVNLGDIIVEGDDIFGDGVNVAARLEGIAQPGGIAVSATVRDHVGNRLELSFHDMGEQVLKNIEKPVRVYSVSLSESVVSAILPLNSGSDLTTTAKATIAVLPFTNMSSDPEQEYFGDGLAEDLITDLSKVPGLVVIARNSSFAYKGKPVDLRSIAKDLDVRYIVEGSVRRASNRIRINAQLIDAAENSHIWADRFDRDLADIFALQDEVVARIVNALSGVLPSARPVATRRATNLEAYDLLVRARALAMVSPEGNRAARPLLERSIQIDPAFAEAHAWLAMTDHFGWMYWGYVGEENPARAIAERAVALDPENSEANMILGFVRAYRGELTEGIAGVETALRLNPNHADAWVLMTDLMVLDGRAVEGIECARRAFRLNPYPPGVYYWALGWAEYAAGRYSDAVETLRHEEAHRLGSRRILAASLAQLGRENEAHEEARQFLAGIPQFSTRHWASRQPFRDDADRQHFVVGYLKAGLPE